MLCSLQSYEFGRLNSSKMCENEATWWELDEEDSNVKYPVCTMHKAKGFQYIEMAENELDG